VRITAPANSLVKLTVPSVTVVVGGCVQFVNGTSLAARVTISGTSYAHTIPARGATSGSSNYRVATTVTVRATSGLRSGSGTITARKASPRPSSSAQSPSSAPTRSGSPAATPDVAPSPHHRHHHKHKHRVKISLPPLPPLPTNGLTAAPKATNPLVAPGLTTTAPIISPTPTSTETTAAAVVVDSGDGSGRGMPALIGAVLVVGLLVAFGRVVLAFVPAVDDRSRRRHRA
jgi:hypothetical protein